MKWIKKKKKCDNCNKEQGCSECKKYQDKAFELEVDEELQQERLTQWWKKYSWLVYGAIALILLITAGTEWYRSYRMKIRLSESDTFEQAMMMSYSGKTEEAISIFEKLGQTGNTGYRVLALMNLAELQMTKGEREKALETMQTILHTTSQNDPLHLVTTLSYVGYQLDSKNPDEMLKILEPALKNNAFQGLATELAAILLRKQGKEIEAKELIQKALMNPTISENSKARLNTLKGE